MSVNADFDGVVAGIREQHGENCWFYEPLVASFKDIADNPGAYDGDSLSPVRVLTFEVWDEAGVLVAGECGYSVGPLYTALSGFSKVSRYASKTL